MRIWQKFRGRLGDASWLPFAGVHRLCRLALDGTDGKGPFQQRNRKSSIHVVRYMRDATKSSHRRHTCASRDADFPLLLRSLLVLGIVLRYPGLKHATVFEEGQ